MKVCAYSRQAAAEHDTPWLRRPSSDHATTCARRRRLTPRPGRARSWRPRGARFSDRDYERTPSSSSPTSGISEGSSTANSRARTTVLQSVVAPLKKPSETGGATRVDQDQPLTPQRAPDHDPLTGSSRTLEQCSRARPVCSGTRRSPGLLPGELPVAWTGWEAWPRSRTGTLPFESRHLGPA